MDDSGEERCVLHHLLLYWQARPQAADTLEGIQRWWLGEAVVSRAMLAKVLDGLVKQGVVDGVTAADGRVRFRLAKPAGGKAGAMN